MKGDVIMAKTIRNFLTTVGGKARTASRVAGVIGAGLIAGCSDDESSPTQVEVPINTVYVPRFVDAGFNNDSLEYKVVGYCPDSLMIFDVKDSNQTIVRSDVFNMSGFPDTAVIRVPAERNQGTQIDTTTNPNSQVISEQLANGNYAAEARFGSDVDPFAQKNVQINVPTRTDIRLDTNKTNTIEDVRDLSGYTTSMDFTKLPTANTVAIIAYLTSPSNPNFRLMLDELNSFESVSAEGLAKGTRNFDVTSINNCFKTKRTDSKTINPYDPNLDTANARNDSLRNVIRDTTLSYLNTIASLDSAHNARTTMLLDSLTSINTALRNYYDSLIAADSSIDSAAIAQITAQKDSIAVLSDSLRSTIRVNDSTHQAIVEQYLARVDSLTSVVGSRDGVISGLTDSLAAIRYSLDSSITSNEQRALLDSLKTDSLKNSLDSLVDVIASDDIDSLGLSADTVFLPVGTAGSYPVYVVGRRDSALVKNNEFIYRKVKTSQPGQPHVILAFPIGEGYDGAMNFETDDGRGGVLSKTGIITRTISDSGYVDSLFKSLPAGLTKYSGTEIELPNGSVIDSKNYLILRTADNTGKVQNHGLVVGKLDDEQIAGLNIAGYNYLDKETVSPSTIPADAANIVANYLL